MLLVSFNSITAQKKELKNANNYLEKGEYYLALENFLTAQEEGAEFGLDERTKLARCYYYLNDVDKAFELFAELENDLSGHDIFLYASVQHKFGFYEGAIEWYEKAKKEGENPIQINELIKSCRWATENDQTNLDIRVNPSIIGTFGQSFGMAYYKNGVVYSSAEEDNNSKKDKQGRSFLNLYYSDIVDGEIEDGKKLFSKNLVFPFHVGAISFSSDYSTMYFTKVVRIRGGSNVLKIFSVEFDGNDWVNETELSINSNKYDCAHPAVSRDNKFLYFVSNQEGGSGGKDLYVAEIKGKNQFGKSVNLGREINTFGDEMFPVINPDNKLYFSSDGHYGFGGLDIFSAEYINGKWTNVKNLLKPHNSNYDDFGYVIDPADPERGFLSSANFGDHKSELIFTVRPRKDDDNNNEESAPIVGLEMLTGPVETGPIIPIEETSQDTIVEEPVSVEVGESALVSIVTSTLNNQAIEGVTVILKDAISGNIIGQTITGADGFVNIPISAEYAGEFQEFEIEITKGSEFKPKKMIINIQELGDLKRNGFALTPVFNDVVLDDISGMVIPYIGNEITDEGFKILDQLAIYLMNNPNIVVKLNGHTEARGNRFSNLSQSQTISEEAEKYLESKGVNGDQTIPRGYGERYLVNRCQRGKYCDDAQHLENRRIEVVVWNK